MAVFRYRMQNILAIKEKLEEQEKLAFAQVTARLSQEQQKLEDIRADKAKQEELLRGEMGDTLNVQEIIRLQEGISALQWHIQEQEKTVSFWEKKLVEEQAKLLEAMKERKIQEKLREHALESFLQEEEYAEQKAIDELVVYRNRIAT